MKLIIMKSFIIVLFIVFFVVSNNSYSEAKSSGDQGIISIMYHRFEENKYPSTNIKIEDFKSHISLIKKLNFKFISYEEFNKYIDTKDNMYSYDIGPGNFLIDQWIRLNSKKKI